MNGEVYAIYLLSMNELIVIPTTDHIPPTKNSSKEFNISCDVNALLGSAFSIGRTIRDAIPHATISPQKTIEPPHTKEADILFNI